MNPINALRSSLEIAAAVITTTTVIGYITVTSGPMLAFRYARL